MDAVTDRPLFSQTQDLFFTFSCDGVPDAGLEVRHFEGDDGISGLFCFEIALASRRPDIDPASLTDQPALLTVHDRYGAARLFHGVIAAAEQGENGDRYTFYHVTLMPALHRLRYGSDCRIFQEQTVEQIVSTILRENGVTDFEFRLFENRAPREYCVQYRETHLDFIERLLAEEGISYHHVMRKDGHKLILTDYTVSSEDCPDAKELEFNATAAGHVKGPFATRLSWREEVLPTQFTQRDHWFQNPQHDFEQASRNGSYGAQAKPYALYDFPGRYKDDGIGRFYTRTRLEMHRAEAAHGDGQGRCPHLAPGHFVTLKGHSTPARNRKYLVVTVRHRGVQAGATEEDGGIQGTTLNTQFRLTPHDVPWRPVPRTKPRVEGPQIATVSGPAGEEIHTDSYGRVKVQFPWDRYGRNDDTSSCWIRVSQNWAGVGFGHMAIPRIGQSVIVDYIDADPDQPCITGRVYNAINPVPYELPASKTKMVIRSQTHKGQGFNEISLEDEKDQEEIYVHAQRNQTIHVLNDENTRIDHDRTEEVKHDEKIAIGNDRTESVGNDETLSVGRDQRETIGQDAYLVIQRNQKIQIAKDLLEDVGNYRKESTTSDHWMQTGGNFEHKVAGTSLLEAGQSITHKTQVHTLSGSSKIVVQGPAGRIVIDGGGITLEGKVTIKGTLNMTGGSPPSLSPMEGTAKEGKPFDDMCAMKDDGTCPLDPCPCGRPKS